MCNFTFTYTQNIGGLNMTNYELYFDEIFSIINVHCNICKLRTKEKCLNQCISCIDTNKQWLKAKGAYYDVSPCEYEILKNMTDKSAVLSRDSNGCLIIVNNGKLKVFSHMFTYIKPSVTVSVYELLKMYEEKER